MEDSDGLRRELAALLRDNVDEISARLERKYVEEYPNSRANFMDACTIHQWTLDSIESLAQVVETGDVSLRTYRGQYGDAVVDPHEPELTSFACFVSGCLFEARHIAPFFFRLSTKGMSHVQAAKELFERTIQEIVAHNCELYAASVRQPGSLIRTWDILSGMVPQGEPDDTPAKRYLKPADDSSDSESFHSFPGEELLTARCRVDERRDSRRPRLTAEHGEEPCGAHFRQVQRQHENRDGGPVPRRAPARKFSRFELFAAGYIVRSAY